MVADQYSGEETLGSWDAADEQPVEGCLLAPGTSTEFPDVELDQLSSLATLYSPLQADIATRDRVRVDGALWDVISRPANWPGRLTSGTAVTLRLVREEA